MPTTDGEDWAEEAKRAEEEIERLAAEEVIAARDAMLAKSKGRDSKGSGRDNVVSCRLDKAAMEALDILVETGVRTTRADAAAWLIQIGLDTQQALLDDLRETVAHIHRLRQDAANKVERHGRRSEDR